MRDLLKDLENSQPVDPVRAAQTAMQPQRPKRFYETVSVIEDGQGLFGVQLDGRSLKTPGKNAIALPVRAAAERIAAEFDAQKERIDVTAMPAYRLVNTGLDGVATAPEAVREEILRYAGSDLVCYRAEGPDGLVAVQAEHWDGPLDWAVSLTGGRFVLVEGIMHAAQPRETIAGFRMHLDRVTDPVVLASLHVMTALTGSAILAMGVLHEEWDAKAAWTAAHVDEDWQISQWGADHEAERVRAIKWRDMEAAGLLAVMLQAR